MALSEHYLEKVQFLLIQYLKDQTTPNDYLFNYYDFIELIEGSKLEYEDKPTFKNLAGFQIVVKAEPRIYTKCLDWIYFMEGALHNKLELIIKDPQFLGVNITPDLKRIQVLGSALQPVVTEWEEINQLQEKLVEEYRKATNSTDCQNIGNSSRNLMHRLSRAVFDPERHNNENIPLDDKKYKNKLKVFIEVELEGSSNKTIRSFANTAVDFVFKSIDFMNTTTHSLNAEKYLAELCVIGVISTVGIIKVITEMNETPKLNT